AAAIGLGLLAQDLNVAFLVGLAVRRERGCAGAPTVWMRGAELRGDDGSVGDAVQRALRQAGRVVAASRGDWSAYPGLRDTAGDTLPARVARLAAEAGRPLVILLDGADEMPQALARRLPEWTDGTLDWLRAHDARLVLTCRPEYWETAGALFPDGALHRPEAPAELLPDAVPIGALTAAEAVRVRERYGLTEAAVAPEDARHPLALRLLGEVRAALPDALPGQPCRAEIFAAHTDLACLRTAVRMTDGAEDGVVRDLAARVAGRLHRAARHCLTAGSAELDRETFEELFPWATGWAAAVLAEGLMEPAGPGYRFGHEELGEWIQGAHVDVDALLDALLDRPEPESPPRHRLGVVLQALLRQETAEGRAALARRLERLVNPATTRDGDVGWWAARLLRGVLLRLRDARPYGGVLRLLAGRTAAHPRAAREFGAWFWERLRVGEDERMELFRRLLPADGGGFLEAVALRLGADPRSVQPLLCRWFGDGRPLHAEAGATARPTVGGVARALLHTHRDLAVDDLCEALVSTAHPQARELLARLVDDEPAALCRAVDRWAHDDTRPCRRAAAAAYGRMLAARVTAEADREPLRYAALALLARPGDRALHGTALSLLLGDPRARADHLPRALAEFRDGEPGSVPAGVLTPALATHPEEVLAAFGARLRDDRGAAEVLDALAAVRSPALARRAAALVRAYSARHPAGAPHVAAYVVQRLAQGPAARAVLFPLVAELMRGGADEVRDALARVLTDPEPAHGLRAELLDVLLDREHPADGDAALAEALLRAAALGACGRPEERTRELVLRAGLLLLRTAEGAPRFDRRLTALAREVPGFAVLLSGWTAREPRRWAALVGRDARGAIERLAAPGPGPGAARALSPVPVPALTAMPMQAERRGHGTLRPA
ncbi:serine protease, partial [Streptomyces sp. MUM 203J]|uniref:serine protease n=1 Tax=Streptomyces sp. MUM 203J TaxID=2791990 RepID=UPI001F03CB1F